jgi:hypothetical protein
MQEHRQLRRAVFFHGQMSEGPANSRQQRTVSGTEIDPQPRNGRRKPGIAPCMIQVQRKISQWVEAAQG